MRKVEEYLVLKDASSTVKLLKLDCHSVYNGKAVLRFPGVMEIYEVASIRTHKGKYKDVIEYELGRCIRCLKFESKKIKEGVMI